MRFCRSLAVEHRAQALAQLWRQRTLLTGHDVLAQPMELVEARLQQLVDRGVARGEPLAQPDEQGFQFMAQIAHDGEPGHSGATFERVQITLQIGQRRVTAAVTGRETSHGAIGSIQQLGGLFGEDRGDLRVVRQALRRRLGLSDRLGRSHCGRANLDRPGYRFGSCHRPCVNDRLR